jgi:hypothetical protein
LGSLSDDRHDAFQILHHVIIGESKYRKSLRRKPSVTSLIEPLTRLKVVSRPVELNHNPRRVTDKIRDVVSDRDLATDAETIDSMCLQVAP